jgi:hypothetical protein
MCSLSGAGPWSGAFVIRRAPYFGSMRAIMRLSL